MDISNMTGLEILNAIIEGHIPAPSMAGTMNISLSKVKKGYARFEGQALDSHCNPMGGVHGGYACTILDSVTGCAIHTLLDAGETYGTIDLNVKMVRPLPVGKKLIAESHVINMSQSLGVSDAKLTDEERSSTPMHPAPAPAPAR